MSDRTVAKRTNRPSVRRSQDERSAETKQAINEATVRCLTTGGYAGTTISAVEKYSGVSRGAINHHFGSKHAMLISAIGYLAASRELELSEAIDGLPQGEDRLRAVISLAWATFKGDLFYAALEIWTAARTDRRLLEELRASERELGARHKQLVADLLGPSISSLAGYDRAYETLFNLMRGAALTRILRDGSDNEDRDIDGWVETFSLMTAS